MSSAAVQPPPDEAISGVPELGRLAWMLFFEPVTLFHVLAEAGIAAPGAGVVVQLMAKETHGRAYCVRMGLVLAVLGPLVTLIAAGLFALSGIALPRGMLLGVLLSGVGSALLWAVMASLPFGAALSLALPLAGMTGLILLSSGALDAHHPWLTSVLVGGAPGAAAGLVFGVARALTVGEPLTWQRGGLTALIFGALSVFLTADGGVAHSLVVALSLVVGFGLFCYRVVLWPLEALLQGALYALQRLTGRSTLGWSPVLWHDLSYLPLPFLRAHVELAARSDPDLARRALASCFISPGQRGTGRALQKSLRSLLVR